LKKFFCSLLIAFMLLVLSGCNSAVTNPQGDSITPIPASPQLYSAGPLSLEITNPVDGAETTEAAINLTGWISEDATLSVNDEVFLLKKGEFSQPFALEEGLNLFQIVASDDEGNFVEAVLLVTYSSE